MTLSYNDDYLSLRSCRLRITDSIPFCLSMQNVTLSLELTRDSQAQSTPSIFSSLDFVFDAQDARDTGGDKTPFDCCLGDSREARFGCCVSISIEGGEGEFK